MAWEYIKAFAGPVAIVLALILFVVAQFVDLKTSDNGYVTERDPSSGPNALF